MPSRFSSLTRDELSMLVPELLLIGHLIDRAGMPWCISTFGPDEMAQVAIDEWAAASPIYSKRMQRALGFEGDDVPTIFKNIQLDIGAPPQFMDFRFALGDRWHGEFWLDHCGALMDVEPLGEDYVVRMCHDIEDPTFDATAATTNPRARVRPVHRPPRASPDAKPHCKWTVVIDESVEPLRAHPAVTELAGTMAARWRLDDIDPDDEGRHDYAGALLADLDFADFSHSALSRLADEICLQMHLLNLGFRLAVGKRASAPEQALDIARRQLIGHAGIAAERLQGALRLPATPAGALQLLALHPLLNPSGYVAAHVADDVITVSESPAHHDGAWIALCGPHAPEPLRAAVRTVDPRFDVRVEGTETDWSLAVVQRDEPHKEPDEVALVRFSTGVDFEFRPRTSLPITVL
ncbi:MAG: hypothetical protein ACJ735_07770 [Actinomycetes bacterium]